MTVRSCQKKEEVSRPAIRRYEWTRGTDLLVSDDEDLMATRGRELLDVRLIAVANEYSLQNQKESEAV
jgi:hypothetical protein